MYIYTGSPVFGSGLRIFVLFPFVSARRTNLYFVRADVRSGGGWGGINIDIGG